MTPQNFPEAFNKAPVIEVSGRIDREAQAQAGLKYAQTGPQQVAAQSARAKQALAQVAQAQAQLDQAKLNLSYTKIVAPTAGIITRKSVEINQNRRRGRTC